MENRLLYRKVSTRLNLVLILALLASMLLSGWPQTAAAAAATITVNSALDSLANDGNCTLREAVIAANKNRASGSKPGECAAGNGVDTLLLPSGTYTLTRTDNGKEDSSSTGDLDVLQGVTIAGAGADVTTINATNFTDRVFQFFAGNSTISGITISGGKVNGDGGGIYSSATLSLQASLIRNNQASGQGGGIYNAPTGSLTVTGSTIAYNSATNFGGGIFNTGRLSLANTTLSNNLSKTSGGGAYNTGSFSMNNVTIAFNSADSDGNGTGDAGGLFAGGGSTILKNTLLGENIDLSSSTQYPDCSGALTSQGYNLIKNTAGCTLSSAVGDQIGASPNLGSLADNGGPTITHALLAGSPAIDASNPSAPSSSGAACEVTDQRGLYRPAGAACDIGAFEAGQQNQPTVIRAYAQMNGTTIEGWLSSAANTTFILSIYHSEICPTNGSTAGLTLLGTQPITTDGRGDVTFQFTLAQPVPQGHYVTAVASDPNGNTSGYSRCVRAGPGNDSWPRAFALSLGGSGILTASASGYLDLPGQSRWYKFAVQPNSKVTVTLTDLPANYDLTLYKDIRQATQATATTEDLLQLGAEFAPDVFSPDVFSPDVFSPDVFSPDVFSPDVFSPDVFSPDVFSPDVFSPDVFSPDVFSPDVFSPDAFSPDVFSPDVFSPDVFSPDAYNPDVFSPDAFSSAQTRSLIGVSAFDGSANEGIQINTWDNSGEFYVRVRGRNGAFDLEHPFQLQVSQATGICSAILPVTTPTSLQATTGPYRTLILTDLSRMDETQAEKDTLQEALNEFAGRLDVEGIVVDVGQDTRVRDANLQADAHPECAYAKNLVASAIQDIISLYRDQNPGLEYIVIAGNDDVVPFFRYPDQAMLANEKNYAPPMRDNTASQASLKGGYVLGQDAYGSRLDLSFQTSTLPLPDLAVGRLVETPAEIMGMLSAYTRANGLLAPASALVTGYDFLADTAGAVKTELEAGTGSSATMLLSPREAPPSSGWTAQDLRSALLGERHDLIFLAGHFSASSALAADYITRLTTSELLASPVDLTNSLIFSAGCHAGYNIVDTHDVRGITAQPDWAQAFARKGATLIAGTGYQYGDTDFIRYSEKIYLNLSQQLRRGAGPVAVGKALVAAKQAYLAQTPQLRGIDQKALLEATLFGLPMLGIDMPQGSGEQPQDTSIVASTSAFTTNPGASLGLEYADVAIIPNLSRVDVPLTTPQRDDTVTTTYFSGTSGEVVSPVEPVLPLEGRNVSRAGTVLRGVGFRGGDYTDLPGVRPFTSAATTEIRGVHAPFASSVFYPIQPWRANSFGALIDGLTGTTYLNAIPAQYLSASPDSPTGTLRIYDLMNFRLFYSSYTDTTTSGNITSAPALSAPPAITRVFDSPGSGQVDFQISVVGNPAAGMQEVWITYTTVDGPLAQNQWQSLDLERSPNNSTLWTGSLPLSGTQAKDIRYIVQAVNGVGLVSLDTNLGSFYIPGEQGQPTEPSELQLTLPGAAQPYSTPLTFSARLTNAGASLAGQTVTLSVGPQSRRAITDENGVASTSILLLGLPGENHVVASFAGTGRYQASYATATFEVHKQATSIAIQPQPAIAQYSDSTLLFTTLTDASGRRLSEKTLLFAIRGPSGDFFPTPVITDYAGRAGLAPLYLQPGSYTLEAYFSGAVPLGDQTVTLEDIRFLPSTASSTLTINPEKATVTYAGQTTLQIGETLNLAARVTQAADGEMGDLTLAQVLFEIIDQSSSVVATATGAVDAQGNSTATLSGLAAGQYRIRLSVVGVYFTSTSSEALLNVTSPPICSGAYPSTSQWIWPPNNEFYLRSVAGVTDTQGRPFSVTITGVRQDEPVGTGSASPDAFIISPNLVQLRAERDGSGDGRVYHIFFIAANDLGGSCSGVVRVGVSDNQGGGIDPIDDGPLYDSTVPSPIAAQPASASLTSLALILAPAALSSRKSRATFLTIRCR